MEPENPSRARDPEGERSPSDRGLPDRTQTLVLGAVLLGVGLLAWSLQLRPPLEVDSSPLAALPYEIDDWSARDLPLESTVEAILRADFNVQRIYLHPLGSHVGLYVGYYGTERGGRPEHTPQVCYPNAGWRIESERSLEVAAARGLRVQEMQVEKDGDRALVHFWYRSFRTTGMLGPLDQVRDRFLGRLTENRSDGALVRLSTPFDGEDDLVAARSRLMGFGERLDALLDRHWPTERPASDG